MHFFDWIVGFWRVFFWKSNRWGVIILDFRLRRQQFLCKFCQSAVATVGSAHAWNQTWWKWLWLSSVGGYTSGLWWVNFILWFVFVYDCMCTLWRALALHSFRKSNCVHTWRCRLLLDSYSSLLSQKWLPRSRIMQEMTRHRGESSLAFLARV